jgi:diguanylate cyclase (GGDEF)-like protein/PAS domain S-box-containing protein
MCPSANNLRLLIVEDSPDDTELLLREIGMAGYTVTWTRVETATELVAALERESWDLVLCDYVLPRFSGLDALRILRERGETMPCIVCSGKAGESTAVEAMHAGADDYLLKGNSGRLVPAVRRALAAAEERRRRHKAEQELHLLRQAIDTIPLGVTITDSSGVIIYTNPAEARMHGYRVAELLGKHPRILAPPEAWSDVRVPVSSYVTSLRESINVRKDGTIFPVYLISMPVAGTNYELMGAVSVCEDISARKEVEERLRYMSTHDALTGLYNRAFFELELQRLDHSRQFPVSVIMMDLDGLKRVNDHDGHQAGDALLKQVGKILAGMFRVEDMVARVGGDEFIVLLPVADQATVEHAVERIGRMVAEANQSGKGPMVALSIGAATATEPGSLLECVRVADERMYRDKLDRKRGKAELSQ